jgi:hypothetical protein
MFLEHIGSLLYRSLWSEMLDESRVYHPILPKKPNPKHPARSFNTARHPAIRPRSG